MNFLCPTWKEESYSELLLHIRKCNNDVDYGNDGQGAFRGKTKGRLQVRSRGSLEASWGFDEGHKVVLGGITGFHGYPWGYRGAARGLKGVPIDLRGVSGSTRSAQGRLKEGHRGTSGELMELPAGIKCTSSGLRNFWGTSEYSGASQGVSAAFQRVQVASGGFQRVSSGRFRGYQRRSRKSQRRLRGFLDVSCGLMDVSGGLREFQGGSGDFREALWRISSKLKFTN